MFGVDINDTQIVKIVNWHDAHDCEKETHNETHGVLKGSLWYCVSRSSGIGLAVKGRCECGQEIDVTDYGTW